MAPPLAADALGRPAFTIADLAAELVWPSGTDVGLVEAVGGPRSPFAADGDTVDLAGALEPDAVVLVADAGLGTINAVRLAAPALAAVSPLTVVLNRFDGGDDLHRRNRSWLEDHEGLTVVDSVPALCDRLTAPLD
jgi:dethiobiotin synthetase